jgi:hypothetical protein
MMMVLRPLFGCWSCYPKDPRTHHRYINYGHLHYKISQLKIKALIKFKNNTAETTLPPKKKYFETVYI